MRTDKRDLRTGLPVWLPQPEIKTDSLEPKTTADVVVIGTGISGALMANTLRSSGLDVIAVDRRAPGTGSTFASTAMLQFDLDSPLMTLGKKIGRDRAGRAWIRSYGAIQALAELIKDLKITCDYAPRNSIYLPGNLLDVNGLKQEAAERQRIGLRSKFIDGKTLSELTGIKKPGAILSLGNAEADPVKLTMSLLRKSRKTGVRIIYPFEVDKINETKSWVKVSATDGRAIVARHVVLCTGYEVPKFIRGDGFMISSTWVIATRPQPKKLWPGRSLVWEASDPYLYMRTTREGRIIVGGEDQGFANEKKRDTLISKKSKLLSKKAQRLFPDFDFTPEYSWAASFGESTTSLPAIGLVPRHKKTFAVLGFGGNGITFSMLAAQIISRTINGLRDPDLELFKL